MSLTLELGQSTLVVVLAPLTAPLVIVIRCPLASAINPTPRSRQTMTPLDRHLL